MCVEQRGLAVVDVTQDRDHRRTDLEVEFDTLIHTELEVEGLQQLAILVLRRNHLDDVVEFLAQQLEGGVVHGLRRGHHLAEVEQHLDERGCVDADLVCEVGQRCATGQANGLPVALADPHAANCRGFHVVELLATLALRLATTARRTTGTPEGTLRGTATAGTALTAWGSPPAGAGGPKPPGPPPRLGAPAPAPEPPRPGAAPGRPGAPPRLGVPPGT